MEINRFTAYLIIAVVGFAVGLSLYYLGVIFGKIVISILPQIVGIIRKPEVVSALLSGFLGMILAIALAYMWVKKTNTF